MRNKKLKIETKKNRNSIFFIFSLLFFILFSAGWSAKRNVNLDDFLKELTVVNVKGSQTQSAVWLPFEFDVRVLGSDVKTQKDVFVLKSYLIFMVQCADANSGSKTYASWSQIQNRALLKGFSSAPVKPLALVPVAIAGKLEAIKTVIAGNDASVADMHIIVFDINDANDPNGRPIVDTTIKDKLTLTLEAADSFSKAQFIWHTPFDAIIDAGICPKCGDKVKPYWRLCPWCGSKL
ncbi:MAG: zinc ribbon domain-containing protein [Phycisphaerae bacterium]|nr:zinc ribbon domain-containing protein [Phycisphaerae bacterium]